MYLFIFAIQDKGVRGARRLLRRAWSFCPLSLCPYDLRWEAGLPQVVDRHPCGNVSLEKATDAFWVVIGVGYEDWDVSRRDKVGATGALAKQIEGLGRRVRLYRCSLHVSGAMTATIA
jgi:hypothetical protein